MSKTLEILNGDYPTLAELNKNIRHFLDWKDTRNEIHFYVEKLQRYGQMIEEGKEDETFPLDGVNDVVGLDAIKFQYAFWFEAMVWFIKMQMGKMEKAAKEAQENKEKGQ